MSQAFSTVFWSSWSMSDSKQLPMVADVHRTPLVEQLLEQIE
jgi:hypothetical protein